jgi:hypothetical protein
MAAPDMMAPYTMRMLGQDLTLTRSQWLELHDLISSITLNGQSERARIRNLLNDTATCPLCGDPAAIVGYYWTDAYDAPLIHCERCNAPLGEPV